MEEKNTSPIKEVTFAPDTNITPTKRTKKSLVGLSPQQDAKIGMLK